MSTKSMQKVKIEMRAKSTLKEPSITYSGHIVKSTDFLMIIKKTISDIFPGYMPFSHKPN